MNPEPIDFSIFLDFVFFLTILIVLIVALVRTNLYMENGKIRRWKPFTISFPESMLQQLDYIRNDVSRSRYIQRLIQEHLKFLDTAVEL